jgi:hypothetical protein
MLSVHQVLIHRVRSSYTTFLMASIMASVTPSASVPGKSTSVSEERGVAGLRRHAEWPKVANAVIAAAAMRSAVRLSASNDNTFTMTNSTSCIPSPSVTSVRKMLESCDYRAGSEKRNGKMFRRHPEWPKVADAVIEAHPIDITPPPHEETT